MNTYTDVVFVSMPKDHVSYQVVAYTNNLENEIIACVLDIVQSLNEHFNGHELAYYYDYSNGQTHYVLGTWSNGHMVNVQSKDEIMPAINL